MQITLEELIEEIRSPLNEPKGSIAESALFYKDTEIAFWINQVKDTICQETALNFRVITKDLEENQQEIEFSSFAEGMDIFDRSELLFHSSDWEEDDYRPLEIVNEETRSKRATSTTFCCVISEDKITLNKGACSGDKIRLAGKFELPDLKDMENTLNINKTAKNVILKYCVTMGKLKKGKNTEEAMFWNSLYQKNLEDLKVRSQKNIAVSNMTMSSSPTKQTFGGFNVNAG